MTQISEFILNLVTPDITSLSSQTGDLVIYETGLTSDGAGNMITSGLTLDTTEIAALKDQGRGVIGYLNVSVTDHNRGYWQDGYVDYAGPGGGGAGNRDVGDINPLPPAWLANNHGYATDGVTTFGYIVDYTNADWRARVIAEAVHMVTPAASGGLGLTGVFLDDVGRYYQAAANDPAYSHAQAALDMMTLVSDITDAVETVSPDTYVAVNGGAYIGGDAGVWFGDVAAQTAWARFLPDVDALMMESQYGSSAWPDAVSGWGPGHDFLSVEHATVLADPEAYANWARGLGLVPHVAANSGYDAPAVTPGAGSPGADAIHGGDGPNHLDGQAGNDTIHGGGGDDRLWGRAGSDALFGQAADDTLFGHGGNDLLRGGTGADMLGGGWGRDTLHGEVGNDTIKGGTGADTIKGGAGVDRMWGGAGAAAGDGAADVFVFAATGDSGTTWQTRDRIMDFERGLDVIDVSAIDPVTGPGDSPFAFLGTRAFTGVAGEMRFERSGNGVVIEADGNGDMHADFSVKLVGLYWMTAADFIL